MGRKVFARGQQVAPRRSRRLAIVLGGLFAVAMCVVIRYYWGAGRADAEPKADEARAAANAQAVAAGAATAKVVATVNGEDISRAELGEECVRHFGREVLDSLLNKSLIVAECQRLGIAVTQDEVNREIERFAKFYKVPVAEWLKKLKEERGLSAALYASDFVWPTLALRKLAREQLKVTDAELQAEYEARFGAAVQTRMIACQNIDQAKKVRALAVAKPEEFGNLAKDYSEDPTSASLKGMIQPISRNSGNKKIEEIVFGLKDGEISPVIQVAEQFVIFRREAEIPARSVAFQEVRAGLEEAIRDRKQRAVAGQVFQRLMDQAKQQGTVINVLADPQLARQNPGVAAIVSGRQITMGELAERCIERHGEDVLDGTINRRLLEQACRKRNIVVSEADLDQEIARAAAAKLKFRADGKPDVEAWIELNTKQQGISVEVYRRDAVWPSVALEKLVAGGVQVTEEDLQRGFEANYGPRVRCLAIVLSDLRTAQRVWDMAKQSPSKESFGQLAAKYSVEPGSRALGGEIPPIQKHGGQPVLEKEAFQLRPGELSGIVQIERELFAILLCEGQTEPVLTDFAMVRDRIREDVYEKKLRTAMEDRFSRLQEEATIDNFIAGTVRTPRRAAPPAGATPGVAKPVANPGVASRPVSTTR